MNDEGIREIFNDTLGQTLEITESTGSITSGLSVETTRRYQEASSLSDDEIWARLQKGEL